MIYLEPAELAQNASNHRRFKVWPSAKEAPGCPSLRPYPASGTPPFGGRATTLPGSDLRSVAFKMLKIKE